MGAYLKLKGDIGGVSRMIYDGHPVVTLTLTTDDEVYDVEMGGKFAESLYKAAVDGARVEMRGCLRKSWMYGGKMQQARREVFYPEWFAVLPPGK